MKLFDLRKELKNEFASLDIEKEDVDFIISETLNVKRTDLVLIEEISDAQEKEIRKYCELRKNNIPVDKIFQKSYL